MTGRKKQYKIPSRETILKYLNGGLTPSERHRMEKLMLENPVLADIVEGLESQDPNLIESDLRELSSSVPSTDISFDRSWSVYRIAATILLLTVSGIALFFLISEAPLPFGKSNISMNQEMTVDSTRQAEEGERITKEKDDIAGENESQDEIEIPAEESISEVPAQENLGEEQSEPEDPGSETLNDELALQIEIPDETEISEIEDTSPAAGIAVEESEEETAAEIADEEIYAIEDDSFGAGETISPSPENLSNVSGQVDAREEVAKKVRTVQSNSPATTEEVTPSTRQATPVNGFDSFRRYINENLSYPEEAQNAGIEGTVELTFVVGLDSIPQQIIVNKSLGYGCDQEAIELIRQGPKWLPAIENGQPVEAEAKVEIDFEMEQ